MDLSVERLKLSDADDGGGEDCLSALPDDLLIHILVLLNDAAAAARTSILARRWRRRRLWALLPKLSFKYIEHRRIGAALAAHEAPDLSYLLALTEDDSPESVSAWLPVAARSLSGHIYLMVLGRKEESEERGGAIHLPCFEKATSICLLGFLRLALPPSGVFTRLKELHLVQVQLHGQCDLGDILSSQRCPSLRDLIVCDSGGLVSLNIHSDSLLHMELSDLHRLQQLTVVAPALQSLKVRSCFTDPLNPDTSVANISAPQLTLLKWVNAHPSSIQLDKKIAHLESLGIQLIILEGEDDEEVSQHNHYSMSLLQRFDSIPTLDLQIFYPQDICTGPYLMEQMPRLPNVTFLALRVLARGHSLGANSFDVLRSFTGVKKLKLDFTLKSQLEEHTPCPSGCICDGLPNWRTEGLALNRLEEIEIVNMGGTDHEIALVQRLFHWATALKRVKITLHVLLAENKAKELRQFLLSFSRPDICMDVRTFF